MLKNGAHVACAPCSIPSALFAQFDLTKHTWFDHRRTNAMLEGLNSVIQSIKRAARGFRNFGYFKTLIYLRLGQLSFDLPPQVCYPPEIAKGRNRSL